MLYIFDLGNVIIDIDFNRVFQAWSDDSGIPVATLQQRFQMNQTFCQHERGEITDQQFASAWCEQHGLPLTFAQFSRGWLAIFVGLRQEVIDIMQLLRHAGHQVVVLSNTNHLHTCYWQEQYPQVCEAADAVYLSQQMGLRKPEAAIYQQVLDDQQVKAAGAVFFDDNLENIQAAQQHGIHSILVTDRHCVPDYFATIGIISPVSR